MSGMEELARLINSEAGNELVILRNQDGRPDASEERDRQRHGERLWSAAVNHQRAGRWTISAGQPEQLRA